MNHFKDKKSSPRHDIQEILLRMKNRFVNGEDSDSEDRIKEEIMLDDVKCFIKVEVPLEKSPDDEIAELMLQLNGQADEELEASIRSQKKMYENIENQSEVKSTNDSDQIEEEKPRIILTLRPNENNPDSYVSSSSLTDYNSNSAKRKKSPISISAEVTPLKRSSRRSNDSNQSVLKSAIARKERTFSTDVDSMKRLPKKIKKEPMLVTSEVTSVNTQPTVENGPINIKNADEIKQENITDQKRKKKKFFRGGRYNIFKRKTLQKDNKKVKKSICPQLNSESGYFEIESSETNSEKHSASVCSDVPTLMSSDKNYQDDMGTTSWGTSLSSVGIEDKMIHDNSNDVHNKDFSLCLCTEQIQVALLDEGKITCKAEDCVDGRLMSCDNIAHYMEDHGNMVMQRANVILPFSTFCEFHMKRFLLHQSCPRCGRFCAEGIFMMCKNKHFFHIGCHQKESGCLHCGISDVYDVEIKRIVIKENKNVHTDVTQTVTVKMGSIILSSANCPPEIDVKKLSKYLQDLKDELANVKRTLYSVSGLYEVCEINNITKLLSMIGARCNLEYKFSKHQNKTALHAACSKGNLIIVYLLLQAGVDPNVVDDKMNSPMKFAAKFGHSLVVQLLMNFGGCSGLKNIHGMTTLHAAAKHGRLECCKVILNNRPTMTNWRDHGGWTPLVWACENSHVDVVKFFITYKPNTRIPDDENNVALHWAATSTCLEVVKCIVEYDSEVNMFNDAGDTALHIAARKNAADIVSYLIEKGAMAWHKNKAKKRPIDCSFVGTKCHTLLKNVPPKQRKPVTVVKPFVPIIPELEEPKNDKETSQLPVFVKKTPVIVSEDITHGCEDVPIRCVNEVDDEVPVEFTYIKENCYDVGNHVDSAMSHIASCNCEGACNTSACKCVQANGECLYDENGRLNSNFNYFNPSVILYECNLRCKCHKQKCGNRVIQKGIKVELELYRIKDMGWGVRVRHDIPRGTFVCEYVGEIITDQKANSLKEDSYLFNLENPGANELYCIDAFYYSNVSRFINHSCDPNLMSVRSFINHHDKRFPRIAFFAVQDIKKNEQLCYNYGTAFWKIKGGLFTCKCGKDNCCFSDETFKNLCLESDDEELELNGITEISKLSDDKKSDANAVVKNKINPIKSEPCKIQLLQNSELKNEHTSLSVSKSSSLNSNALKNNNFKELVLKNGLPEKNKFIRVVKTKEPIKTVSKQLSKMADGHSKKILESKSVHSKPKKVVHEKKMVNKMVNGSSSKVNSKKVSVTKNKSSVVLLKQKQLSSKLIQPVCNKDAKTYVLRPKMSSSNKQICKIRKSEDNVSNNVLLKLNNFGNKRSLNVLWNASSSCQKTGRNLNELNNCDQLIESVKIEPVSKESETDQNIFNGYSESLRIVGLPKEEFKKEKFDKSF